MFRLGVGLLIIGGGKIYSIIFIHNNRHFFKSFFPECRITNIYRYKILYFAFIDLQKLSSYIWIFLE